MTDYIYDEFVTPILNREKLMAIHPLVDPNWTQGPTTPPTVSDGSSADYYKFPKPMNELQDIISWLDCNAQLGEIGRAWCRYGRCSHSDRSRDLKKIIFYAQAELRRLAEWEEK